MPSATAPSPLRTSGGAAGKAVPWNPAGARPYYTLHHDSAPRLPGHGRAMRHGGVVSPIVSSTSNALDAWSFTGLGCLWGADCGSDRIAPPGYPALPHQPVGFQPGLPSSPKLASPGHMAFSHFSVQQRTYVQHRKCSKPKEIVWFTHAKRLCSKKVNCKPFRLRNTGKVQKRGFLCLVSAPNPILDRNNASQLHAHTNSAIYAERHTVR